MSVIRCTMCTNFIDTDFESEFYPYESNEPVCESCWIDLDDDEEEGGINL